jgi:predicted phosphodiesterase
MANSPGVKTVSPADRIIAVLSKPNVRLKFKDLAVKAKINPAELSKFLIAAREIRPDLTYGKFDRTYWLTNTPTWYSNSTDLSGVLNSDGEIGVVSDTHLASVADRLDLLNEAYDIFRERGIEHVFHIGDLTDGWKEYQGHINFVKCHGNQEQALYAIEKYPRRAGIKTIVIGGNHDDSYKESKVDRLSLVTKGFHHQGSDVSGRADIQYVGQYSHYIIFPQEIRMHMLHPRGNQAYSFSYKQQKRAAAFSKNDRPDIQLSGHFHTYCHIIPDGTHMIAAPGMQDETELSKRMGLPKDLGFMVIQYTIRKGQIVAFAPLVFMRG